MTPEMNDTTDRTVRVNLTMTLPDELEDATDEDVEEAVAEQFSDFPDVVATNTSVEDRSADEFEPNEFVEVWEDFQGAEWRLGKHPGGYILMKKEPGEDLFDTVKSWGCNNVE